eukprot:UN07511
MGDFLGCTFINKAALGFSSPGSVRWGSGSGCGGPHTIGQSWDFPHGGSRSYPFQATITTDPDWKCRKCKAEMKRSWKFCGNCGLKSDSVCSNCGLKFEKKFNFCHECGTKQPGSAEIKKKRLLLNRP